jgi:hypothetical protein
MFPLFDEGADPLLLVNKETGATVPISLQSGAPLLNERQALELAKVPKERRVEVLRIAFDTAPKHKLTAAHIKQVAQTFKTSQHETAASKAKHKAETVTAKPDKLQWYEQQLVETLKAIHAQQLWRKAPARSFDAYLDGLVERIKGEL